MTVHDMLAPWRTSLDRSDEDTLRRLLDAVDRLVNAAEVAGPLIPRWDSKDRDAAAALLHARKAVRP